MKSLFEDIEVYSVKERSTEKISFEGSNKRQVLLICPASLTADQRALLSRILSAVKLELNDVALLHSDSLPPYRQLEAEMDFRKMILFGIAPAQLSLNISCPEYTPVNFQGVEILVSESLMHLEGNSHSKDMLWKALKKMFG